MTVLIDAFPSERSSLQEIITNAGLSRMYGGIHYRFDIEAGQAIGRGAAKLALAASRKWDSAMTISAPVATGIARRRSP